MKVRAAVLWSSGQPAPYVDSSPFTVEELDLDGPGPGEVLLRNAAAGVCHSDLSVVDGSRSRPLPMVLGHEAAGIVEEIGPGVAATLPELAVGDHVVYSFVPTCGACVSCQSGRPAMCEPGVRANVAGTLLGGERRLRTGSDPVNHHLGVSAFAERSVVSAASVVRVTPDVELDTAALFGCALVTGIGALVNTAQVRPGQSVVVFGLGGVGLSAVMGAAAAGAYPVIAVDPAAHKLAVAEQVGASHTVQAGPSALEEIRDLTAGGGDITLEAVGNAAVLADAYAAARRGGTVVTVGLPAPDQMVSIPALSLVSDEKRLLGSFMGSAVPRRDIPRLLELYRAGRLPVDKLTTGVIGLEDLNAAFDALVSVTAIRQIVHPVAS